MGDYTNNKDGLGDVIKDNSIATVWGEFSPLITPEKLVQIHLKGIPLVSGIINPFTKKADVITNDDLKEYILEAVSLAETEAKVDIFPHQYQEKHPYDKPEYDQFGYMQLKHRPVQSLQSIGIVASNQALLYDIPIDWVDVGHLHGGQINMIPLTLAVKQNTQVAVNTASSGGAGFLSLYGQKPWVPSYFQVVYTTGFKDGLIPRVLNHLIGVIAAMETLSLLAATYSRSNSSSLAIDGLSQSVSTPGPNLFTQRLTELAAKRKWLVSRLQANTGMSILVDNV